VVDAQGRRQPLQPKSFTPLVLSLPPGRYTATLSNPNYPRPVSVAAEVLAGAPTRSVAEFGHFEADDLFKGLGW